MKLFYIVNTRMPTGKAHGLTIMKSCDSFAYVGLDVTLVTPSLKEGSVEDLFGIYRLDHTFAIRYLPVWDLMRWSGNRAAFTIRAATFYIAAFVYMLTRERRDTIVYTRDVPLIFLLPILGFKVVYECHMIPKNRSAFFRICRGAFRIIAISEALRDAFIAEDFDENKILVAPSGVDLSIFSIETSTDESRKDLGLPLDTRIVTYTGNFTTMGADKGIADIIASLKELSGVVFVAAGGAVPDIDHYESLAREKGVADRVHLFGQAPQATLALYQRAANILLMPFPDTPHYRNHMSPVKMFEYMASGRPIVASDLPTIREVLNEKNAVIVPPGNPSALAVAIGSLLDDSTRAETLAKHAHADVLEYTWQRRAEKILGFLQPSS